MKSAAKGALLFAAALIGASTFDSAKAVVTVDDTDTLVTTSNASTYTLAGFDATSSDKLVVTFGGEGSAGTKSINSVTYGGRKMREAVQHTNSSGSQTTAIYYFDAPPAAEDIVVNWSGSMNGLGMAALALSDTAPGFALGNGNDGTSVTLTTTVADTFAVASFVVNDGTVGVVPPLTTVYIGDVGSAEGATGYQNVATAGMTTFSFTGSGSRPATVAAGFVEGVTDTDVGAFEEVASQTFESPPSGVSFSPTGLDTNIGDDTAWSKLSNITGGSPNATFTGAEGSDYFYGQRTDGATKSITFDAVDLSSIFDPRLEIALAANTGVWDASPDDLVILLDKDNDGTFETTLADFSRIGSGNLALNGQVLGLGFQDFELLLPEDATNAALRIDFITSGDSFEAIGIDNIRFIGRQAIDQTSGSVPEPATILITFLGLLGMGWLGRRRRKRA